MTKRPSKFEAIQIASDYVASKGFTLESGSTQSNSLYYAHPDYLGLLRISDHECRHGFDIVESLEFIYREAWQRDEDDCGLWEEQITECADWSMERFFEAAEKREDGDE
jgi:hypothetical protein